MKIGTRCRHPFQIQFKYTVLVFKHFDDNYSVNVLSFIDLDGGNDFWIYNNYGEFNDL